MHASNPPPGPLCRWLSIGLGLLFVGLAAVGTLLPVLPTTPFLLLASFFFVRSSPRLNAWLLRSRLFGPLLEDWQKHRAVRPRVKVTAISVMLLFGGGSAYMTAHKPWVLVLLGSLLLVGLVVVLRLPLLPATPDPESEDVAAEPCPGPCATGQWHHERQRSETTDSCSSSRSSPPG